MPQKKKQTHQEATELAISSRAKEKLSTHLKQMSEDSKWINIHACLLLQLHWHAGNCSI